MAQAQPFDGRDFVRLAEEAEARGNRERALRFLARAYREFDRQAQRESEDP